MESQADLFPNLHNNFKVTQVIKRNGRIVSFNPEKITNAIFMAATKVGGNNREQAEQLTQKVLHAMNEIYSAGATPSVEEIQDIIEKMLIEKYVPNTTGK